MEYIVLYEKPFIGPFTIQFSQQQKRLDIELVFFRHAANTPNKNEDTETIEGIKKQTKQRIDFY